MSGPDWYRWYPAKWASGVIILTPEQRGVYIDIINVIYDRGSCPEDYAYLSRVCNCRTPRVRRIVGELVQHGKLTIVSGTIRQERAHTERINSEQFSELQRNRVNKRYAKSSKNNGMTSTISPSTNTTTTTLLPPTNSESNYESESESPPSTEGTNGHAKSKANRRKPKRPISDDWEPGTDGIAYAHSKGMRGSVLNDEANQFIDRCKRDGSLYADFDAAWRTWVRNWVKFSNERKNLRPH